MRRTIKLAIIITTAMLTIQPLQALHAEGKNSSSCSKKAPRPDDRSRMDREPRLSDEQVKKIAVIDRDHEKRTLDYREKIAPRRIRLQRMLLEDPVDINAVRTLIKEISDLEADMHVMNIRRRLDMDSVLTAEQRDTMKRPMTPPMMGKGPGPGGFGPWGFGPDPFGPDAFGPDLFGPDDFGPGPFGPDGFGPDM
ncbi:MAG: periplasmic heavy metal sensor [Spirochaetes bacterium]|nr:periplasmic heavy metal sensor [Spirochaetota bacterium]